MMLNDFFAAAEALRSSKESSFFLKSTSRAGRESIPVQYQLPVNDFVILCSEPDTVNRVRSLHSAVKIKTHHLNFFRKSESQYILILECPAEVAVVILCRLLYSCRKVKGLLFVN
jgi:hypothetical protein